MKNILFPTDFSPNADNALNYAVEITRKIKGNLILFHAYSVQLIDPNMPAEIYLSAYQEEEKSAKENLDALCRKLIESNKGADGSCLFNIDTIVSQGLVVDEVLALSDDFKIDLIIMGTHGASGITELILGSNTASVIEKATVPVLAIPHNINYKDIEHIVYAYDDIKSGLPKLSRLLDLAKIYESNITLLHIIESEKDIADVNRKEFEKIKESTDYGKIELELVKEENILEGINDYVNSNDVDILAMTIKKRSLFDKIFSRSLTKKMAYHTKIPLLALHK
ncbi:MAG TPA: universal stress protein [Ignavibacteria bacterium]|nr:universal stress protein [Ignavibacteria bacterium]HMR39887.1 universal stress protein [Ignavibacteria bacterium]